MSDVDGKSAEVAALRAECDRLRAENARLRSLLAPAEAEPLPVMSRPTAPIPPTAASPMPNAGDASVTSSSSVGAKLALFGKLFRGRDDVFALRWQSNGGKSGYSPACAHEWDRALCGKPRVKCAECPNRVLLPLTEEVLQDHLIGRCTVGVYPLLPDENCHFLALDFDKAEWRRDVSAFCSVCAQFEVPAYAETSRSGEGAHAWVFFEEAIPGALARRLGSALLTSTTALRHEVGLDSYDRLFPGQDTLPKGGFGNLIALPLQGQPRREGKSVFVDEDLQPAPDQWQLLSGAKRLSHSKVERVLASALAGGDALGERIALAALPADEGESAIQAVYSALGSDPDRNALIVDDVLATVAAGRSPLVLTERTEHRDRLAELLAESLAHVLTISGGLGSKARRAIAEAIAATPDNAPRVLVATGRCVGEGFDDSRLDTLFLAMPVAWRGTLQQYAGRLHRAHAGKTEVLIYDYVDEAVPVLARMHTKRLAGYRAMGYTVAGAPLGPESLV